MWDNAADPGCFVLAACTGTHDDKNIQALTPIPMGSAASTERFLQERDETIREMSHHNQEIGGPPSSTGGELPIDGVRSTEMRPAFTRPRDGQDEGVLNICRRNSAGSGQANPGATRGT